MISTYHRLISSSFLLLALLFTSTTAILMIPRASAQQQQQQKGYTPESLFIALLADGNALVEYDISVPDPLNPGIKIKLFGEDISNLIVVDYEDNVIKFQTGSSPNEIILNTPGASNIRISYTTPDFLSKDKRDWIFALNSPIGFSVKLPPDSILTDQGQNQPSIRIVGGQSLLTFKPDNVRFVYVIGTLGTQEQANISIKAAQSTIEELRSKYSNIVLTNAKDLLQNATVARDAGRFADADKIANQANDAAIATGRDYEAAQKSIVDARNQINNATAQGRDTTSAKQLLQQANAEFGKGDYATAKNSANGAVAAIGSNPGPQPALPLSVIIAAVVAVGGGGGALVFLRMRKHARTIQQPGGQYEDPGDPVLDNNHTNISNNNNNNNHKTAIFQPPSSLPPPHSTEVEEPKEKSPIPQQQQNQPDGIAKPMLENGSAPIPTIMPGSQTDKSTLSRIVCRIIEDRPHLRPEDQQVLKFLVEKEGAAFESEIRGKFQLPKTTIWRLVKRLEREDLVEIRKAGGQNLIKLKFEDRPI